MNITSSVEHDEMNRLTRYDGDLGQDF